MPLLAALKIDFEKSLLNFFKHPETSPPPYLGSRPEIPVPPWKNVPGCPQSSCVLFTWAEKWLRALREHLHYFPCLFNGIVEFGFRESFQHLFVALEVKFHPYRLWFSTHWHRRHRFSLTFGTPQGLIKNLRPFLNPSFIVSVQLWRCFYEQFIRIACLGARR
jgi:hypothetical protein